MVIETTYLVYLLLSLAVTIWVARTLSTNGRRFLIDGFGGDEALADSVNHLLVVGFYLVNLGFVCLALRYGAKPVDLQTAIEFLTTKIGLVLLVLGVMHLFNVKAINNFRTRFKLDAERARELELRAARQAGCLADTI